MVPRTWAPGAGPTHCREGLFGVEPFARDPGWGQERPGWACAGAGGSLGVLAFSSTSPILWSPTRLATPRADAGPKPQRLKVRGQAGLCTCLCLIQCSENSQLCLEAPSSPGNPSRQLCGQAWACPQLLQAHWVGCQAPGLWQFAHPRPLSLLQRGLAPGSKGKARAELRPARRQARLPHSRSLLLPGRER